MATTSLTRILVSMFVWVGILSEVAAWRNVLLKSSTRLIPRCSTASSSSSTSISKTNEKTEVLIIGAGVGGLCTAGRLAKAGYSVRLVEKNIRNAVGGRLNEYRFGRYRWETGPSLLLLPQVYEETFAALGLDFGSIVNLQKVEPSYLVTFGDGDMIHLYTNRTIMQEAVERIEPGAFENYVKYLDSAQANLDFGFSAFIEENPDIFSLPAFLDNAFKFWPLEGHFKQLESLFATEKMRAAMSFQDLYVGLTPYDAPAVFNLLQAIELNQGVFYPIGGFAALARKLLEAIEGMGIVVDFNAQVEEIMVTTVSVPVPDGGDETRKPKEVSQATGVRLKDGRVMKADVVISNVDVPFSNKYLLPPAHTQAYDHDRKKFSSSVVSICWALDQNYPALCHHSVFLAAGSNRTEEDGGRKAWDAIFTNNTFDPEHFNFYVHAPARTDPTCCPPGHDSLMILVPCPILEPEEEEDGAALRAKEGQLQNQVREALIKRLQKVPGMELFRNHIIHERIITPLEWKRRYSVSRGSVFGLRHNLGQLSLFRPGLNNGKIKGLHHVGASNRPGNGVPLVMVGAKLAAQKIAKMYPIDKSEDGTLASISEVGQQI